MRTQRWRRNLRTQRWRRNLRTQPGLVQGGLESGVSCRPQPTRRVRDVSKQVSRRQVFIGIILQSGCPAKCRHPRSPLSQRLGGCAVAAKRRAGAGPVARLSKKGKAQLQQVQPGFEGRIRELRCLQRNCQRNCQRNSPTRVSSAGTSSSSGRSTTSPKTECT